MKEKVVVICPGRGTYNSAELGYLRKNHQSQLDRLKRWDQYRQDCNQPSVLDLDNADKFQVNLHTPGENAAALISICSIADYYAINQQKYEIVAIAGNSMGWYTTLACARVLNEKNSFTLINTMGSMMKDGLIGGQIIYPIVDDNWLFDNAKLRLIENLLGEINSNNEMSASISIHFGGYVVIGGTDNALKVLLKKLPVVQDRFPFKLVNNGAFHTPLMQEISERAFSTLPISMFESPKIPIVDGLGRIWSNHTTNILDLYEYTLGTQVCESYDFTHSISIALKEFAPDKIIILGPGSTLGGAVGQILIKLNWLGISNKETFVEVQKENPFMLSMGLSEQRSLVI